MAHLATQLQPLARAAGNEGSVGEAVALNGPRLRSCRTHPCCHTRYAALRS